MKYTNLVLIAAFKMSASAAAAAESSELTPSLNNVEAALQAQEKTSSSVVIKEKNVVQFESYKMSIPQKTSKVRTVREPLPGQQQSVRRISSGKVIALPHYNNSKMRILAPSMEAVNRSPISSHHSK